MKIVGRRYFRSRLQQLLLHVGLLDFFRSLRSGSLYRFLRFKREFSAVLQPRKPRAQCPKRALLVQGPHSSLAIDLSLIKTLEVAGYLTVPLILGSKHLAEYYSLASTEQPIFLSDCIASVNDFTTEANAIVEQASSVSELLAFEFAEARVGRVAVSTTLRTLRCGTLDLTDADVRASLARELAECMRHATASQRLLREIKFDCAVFHDLVYTRRGVLFDNCLANNIPVIRWTPAHKSNAIILKRYTPANRHQHPLSLSTDSWAFMQEMEWTDKHRTDLLSELNRSYTTGDWYGESATQFRKRSFSTAQLRSHLKLDPAKKTAIIFPHILWDAPHCWGENLFEDYEEWFIETVRAACRNDQVNWVIKIHPANVGKAAKERYQAKPAEVVVLDRKIGNLPSHVTLLEAESEVSTISLFELMDYCLTVRGTIGIEAASRGIPVLTAGTGRYDNLGFTIDSASREEYLTKLDRIQDIARLDPSQQELAERFAYAAFLMRPLPLKSVGLEFRDVYGAANDYCNSRIIIKSPAEWESANDVKTLANWINDSSTDELLTTQ